MGQSKTVFTLNILHPKMSLSEPFSSEGKFSTRENDLHYIEALHDEIHRPLDYFGLPSPWMGDIKEWIPHIDSIIVVEMDSSFVPDLMDTAYMMGVMDKTHYLEGDIDVIINEGSDQKGREIFDYFPVELINLDYCGGLLYDGFERVQALEGVFEIQKESILDDKYYFPYFLLFITHNSSFDAGKQAPFENYIEYLSGKINTADSDAADRLEEVESWYKSDACPPEQKHKAFMLGQAQRFAESNGFSLQTLEVTSYEGDAGAPMMHYQFKVSPEDLDSPIPPGEGITASEILDYPVQNSNNSESDSNERPLLGF